jgi:hypothetical protein
MSDQRVVHLRGGGALSGQWPTDISVCRNFAFLEHKYTVRYLDRILLEIKIQSGVLGLSGRELLFPYRLHKFYFEQNMLTNLGFWTYFY